MGRIVFMGAGLAVLALAVVAMMAWASPRSGASAIYQPDSSSAVIVATSVTDAAPKAAMVTSSIEGRSVVTFAGHLTGAVALAWSPDNRTIALGSSDKAVRLLDTQTGQVQSLLGHTDIVYNVAWSQDGTTLASAGTDKSVRLWRMDGGSTGAVATLAGHPEAVSGLAWLPGGEMLASVSAGSVGIELIYWDRDGTRIGDSLRHKSGGGSPMTSVTWSPDAKLFAGAFNDGSIRIWSSQGELLSTLQGHTDGVYTVAWSPAGNTIASGGNDKMVRLWNADGNLLATLSGHTDFVNSVAWSPDGRTLASAGDGAVRLWSATGTPIATLSHGSMKPLFVAWSPDGKKVTSITSESTLWVWNLP
jgi:WD40 repeat protein